MMPFFGTCKTCGRRVRDSQNPVQSICVLVRRPIQDINKDKCPWYEDQSNYKTCDVCKQVKSVIFIEASDKDNIRYICEDCSSSFGTCGTCCNLNNCDFHKDRTTPDFIMKQVQQGNMVLQTQVLNPDKIAIYCSKCTCWNSEEKYCFKQEFGMCKEYKEGD